jgi:hypothetical protein
MTDIDYFILGMMTMWVFIIATNVIFFIVLFRFFDKDKEPKNEHK